MDEFFRVFGDFVGPELPLFALVVGFIVAIVGLVTTSNGTLRFERQLEPGWHRSAWRLVSGGVSDAYFDIDQFLSSPDSRKIALQTYSDIIGKLVREMRGIDRLAFIETDAGPIGALQLKETLVAHLVIPAVVVRPRRRLVAGALKGAIPEPGQKVVIVSDVLTSGRGLLRAKRVLEKNGIDAKDAVVLVRRNDVGHGGAVIDGIRIHSKEVK
jgi:orotate phosphoribosyltransferase